MKRIAYCVLAAAFVNSAGAEDWNFTRQDYQALLKRGEKLTFSKAASWFPKPFQQNLKATLDLVFTEQTDPPSTGGVNADDFFHGHIACELGAEIASLEFDEEQVYTDAAIRSMEERSGEYLRKALVLCKTPLIIYHTYEYSGGPHQSVDDPIRNILARNGQAPEHFSPPPCNPYRIERCGWLSLYQPVLDFAFLVNEEGEIDVTYGSRRELGRITGVPMKATPSDP